MKKETFYLFYFHFLSSVGNGEKEKGEQNKYARKNSWLKREVLHFLNKITRLSFFIRHIKGLVAQRDEEHVQTSI